MKKLAALHAELVGLIEVVVVDESDLVRSSSLILAVVNAGPVECPGLAAVFCGKMLNEIGSFCPTLQPVLVGELPAGRSWRCGCWRTPATGRRASGTRIDVTVRSGSTENTNSGVFSCTHRPNHCEYATRAHPRHRLELGTMLMRSGW